MQHESSNVHRLQVSVAVKDTPEAKHSAKVVNELSAVLHSILQASLVIQVCTLPLAA